MAKTYSFLTPYDELVTGSIPELSKKFGLKPWTLAHLAQKKLKVSKGWKLVSSAA
jgi:hypothetical protein